MGGVESLGGGAVSSCTWIFWMVPPLVQIFKQKRVKGEKEKEQVRCFKCRCVGGVFFVPKPSYKTSVKHNYVHVGMYSTFFLTK